MTENNGLSVGGLKDALSTVTNGGGAYGRNLHPSKQVMLQIGDRVYPLNRVVVSFINGALAVILEGGENV